jgi:hypothetical protein
MPTTLHDISVGTYAQILGSVGGFLEKGRDWLVENGVDPEAVVDMRLRDDMLPFRFQVISVAHHSMGCLKGLEAGEFAPPAGYGEPGYAGLQDLVREAAESVASYADRVESFSGKTVIFRLGDKEIPFTAENFVLTFSLPNFYFHATTTYDMLRMQGVPLGKRHFIGRMRIGA